MLIQGKILSHGNDLSDVYMIRRKVFIEEMGIPEEVEFDGQDENAMHVIVYEEAANKKAVATGRICFDGTNCLIGHIAVLKEHRYKKYGDFTVRMLLNKSFTAGIHDISVLSFNDTVAFFEKIGFHIDGQTDQDTICCRMSININDVKTECKKKT